MKTDDLIVICPCCKTKLWIDESTGGVLKQERPARAKGGFNDLVVNYKKQEAGLGGALDKAFSEEKKRQELTRKKFKLSMENVAEEEKKE
jgi:uncharacterized protein YbaR (Trm112 family)